MPTSRDAALITTAGRSHSLDLEERQRRYILTMAVRTACFIAFLIVPGWWKVATLIAAAVLPAIAVLLANNVDHRPPATLPPEDGADRPALPAGEVLPGTIEEDER